MSETETVHPPSLPSVRERLCPPPSDPRREEWDALMEWEDDVLKFANEVAAQADELTRRLAAVEAERDTALGDLDNHRLYVAEYAGYTQIAKDALAAAEARVEAAEPLIAQVRKTVAEWTTGSAPMGDLANALTAYDAAALSPVADTQQEQPHE